MTLFATDEDIALRASADFWALCPKDQSLASGIDGSFVAADPWTLRSTSVDFAAFGLAPGQVVRLSKPTSVYGADGELYAVAVVGPGWLTLRRKGQASGVGQPPSTSMGLAGVEFAARTLGPQIARAVDDLGRRFGVDDCVPGRRSTDLADPGQLRDAAVLTVLHRQYLDQGRRFAGASESGDDYYAAKARIVGDELDDLLDRIALRWKSPDPAAQSIATTRFSTRLSR